MTIAASYLVKEAHIALGSVCEEYSSGIRNLLPQLRLEADDLQTAQSLCAGLELTKKDISRVLNDSSGNTEDCPLLRLDGIQQSLSNKLFVLQNFAKRICESSEEKGFPGCLLSFTALLFAQAGLNIVEMLHRAKAASEVYEKVINEQTTATYQSSLFALANGFSKVQRCGQLFTDSSGFAMRSCQNR
jgi:hypothetical protein